MGKFQSPRGSGSPASSLDRTFNMIWDDSINAHVQAKNPANRQISRIANVNMQRLFAQRRVYQKRVMHTLKDALEPSDVLLDMMSGDAVATLSLLNARQISRLLLLDGSLSPTFFSASQVLISKYKLENLATTINVGLGAQTNPNT